MESISKMRRDTARAFDKFLVQSQTMRARLGTGGGIVNVPGRPGQVWVRVGNRLMKAYNNRVAATDNLEVTVGYDAKQPNLFQVLEDRSEAWPR